jgi:NAD(P)-dependent dehydrogenase (short-subunit alcohol dehydrogenase family)
MQRLDQQADLVAEAKARGVSVELLALDVENDESVQSAVSELLRREGRIDVLVNNAGIASMGTIERGDFSVMRQMFETNFFGALRVTRVVLPSMREQRSGTIVNISSAAGQVMLPCLGIYSATKAALEAANESLAGEVFALGIRVVLIEPGFVVTPILRRGLESFQLDPGSPYFDCERHTYAIFAQGEQTGSDPSVVAEAIEAALNDPAKRLRYRATPDAEVLISGRKGISDEEWVAMGRHSSDEDYFGEFAVRFPVTG